MKLLILFVLAANLSFGQMHYSGDTFYVPVRVFTADTSTVFNRILKTRMASRDTLRIIDGYYAEFGGEIWFTDKRKQKISNRKITDFSRR